MRLKEKIKENKSIWKYRKMPNAFFDFKKLAQDLMYYKKTVIIIFVGALF